MPFNALNKRKLDPSKVTLSPQALAALLEVKDYLLGLSDLQSQELVQLLTEVSRADRVNRGEEEAEREHPLSTMYEEPKGSGFKIIPSWPIKKCICTMCGETRSVKYEKNDKPYCNACVHKA